MNNATGVAVACGAVLAAVGVAAWLGRGSTAGVAVAGNAVPQGLALSNAVPVSGGSSGATGVANLPDNIMASIPPFSFPELKQVAPINFPIIPWNSQNQAVTPLQAAIGGNTLNFSPDYSQHNVTTAPVNYTGGGVTVGGVTLPTAAQPVQPQSGGCCNQTTQPYVTVSVDIPPSAPVYAMPSFASDYVPVGSGGGERGTMPLANITPRKPANYGPGLGGPTSMWR